ncbi:glycosyltransferase family 4 protein [Roseomonas xinghualingensis]|uniref:glycosyltransferase family 4 protein n=1 Tax=Roseomonas xinghualingensis TaxID=2986475 RepID=UPI0021F11256|nr:glycosyltransferase family 4 protein [Roseomonas sp. SXEYE001]MCV4206155.1 glycosyltransferase family 4 protein [Roseomonas sp. SXEYE001]
MRLLYLHQHYSGPGGATATATRAHAMARALAARGHDVTLACGRYEGAETGLGGPFRAGRREGRGAGFRIVEFDIPCSNAQGLAARSAAFLRYAGRATALAVKGRFDLLLASSTPLTVALPALAAHRLRGLPFVFEIRDPWPELPRALSEAHGAGVPAPILAVLDRLATAACRDAAAVIGLTEGMAETALARGADPARTHAVPNGCDLDLFGPQIAPWRPAEAASWEVLAVYAGAHGRANGLDAAIEAATLLQQQGERRLRLVLVGEGSERRRLMEEAARRGLHNLTFLDPLPKPRLAGLLAGSGIGLHLLAPIPAFAEWTAPNKLMDYLAAGLPVVTNTPGRAARLVEADGDAPACGLAAPPGDAPALAGALAALAADPARRAAMGAAARARAVRLWDRRLHAARFCEILEAAATSPRVPALHPEREGSPEEHLQAFR